MSNWKTRQGQKAVKRVMKRMRLSPHDDGYNLMLLRDALDANHSLSGRYSNRVLQLMFKGWVLAPCKCGGWYRTTKHPVSGWYIGTGCCNRCRRARAKTRGYRRKKAFERTRMHIQYLLRKRGQRIHRRCCAPKCVSNMGRVRILDARDVENYFFCCDAHWKQGVNQMKAGLKPVWAPRRKLQNPLVAQGVETMPRPTPRNPG